MENRSQGSYELNKSDFLHFLLLHYMCDNVAHPKYILFYFFFFLSFGQWLILKIYYVNFCSAHLTKLDKIKHMKVIYKLWRTVHILSTFLILAINHESWSVYDVEIVHARYKHKDLNIPVSAVKQFAVDFEDIKGRNDNYPQHSLLWEAQSNSVAGSVDSKCHFEEVGSELLVLKSKWNTGSDLFWNVEF